MRGVPAPLVDHTRTVPSVEEVATRVPSGLNTTPVTSSAWPVSTVGGAAPSMRVRRALWSCEAVATSEPSGLNAAPTT
ncbi:MAG: hypothetical protein IPJ59_00075 [Nannocystis sp.]|nr:hypothetical protein [Nannocystis sp.]MBK7823628.1 hypothetical protein [Nannocystis sp.]